MPTSVINNDQTEIIVRVSDSDAEFFSQAAAGYATKALQYRNQAETFATSAQTNANIAGDESSAAHQSALNASASAQNAATSATNAGTSETNAGTSETNALNYANNAQSYANSAQQFMQSASNFSNSAGLSRAQAQRYADNASQSAADAQSALDNIQTTIASKQDKLTAGANITIDENNVISATGGGGGGAVDSVNGQTGTVVLDAEDVGALPDTTTASDLGAYVKPSAGIPKTDLASAVQTSLGKADTALQSAPVTSVNSQTGAVVIPTATTSADGLMSSADKTLLDSVTERIASTLPVNTVTGATVSVEDGADNIPVKDLTIDIDYKSGGWTGANVTRCGKNLISKTLTRSQIEPSGVIGQISTYDVSVGAIKTGKIYTITNGDSNVVMAYYTSEPTVGSVSYNGTMVIQTSHTFTAPIDGFVAFRTNASYSTPQLELGSTATTYEPYNGETYAIDWQSTAGTVYGGSLDVTTGVLTSTLASDETELATPQTYQLTPTEVSTLLGANNVWADTGDTTLTYRTSLQPVYDDYSSALIALNGE